MLSALRAWTADFPLATPLHHAKVDTSTLQSLIVEVTTESGSIGTSEVRSNGGYATGEDVDDIHSALQQLSLPITVNSATDQLLNTSTLAAMAIDVATWDAYARENGRSLAALWSQAPIPSGVRTHRQIGFSDGPPQSHQAVEEGYDRLKVRVGCGDIDKDASRVRAIADAATGASLVIDANGAWTHAETLRFAEQTADLNIDWLEQPTPDVASSAGLRSSLPWPLVADESARGPETISNLGGTFDGVHLKLEKSGTVELLNATVQAAKSAGLAVHLGQMDQGRLGCAVTVQLAAALKLDRAEVWGCAHLEDDLTWDLHNRGGLVTVPLAPGTGVTLKNRYLLKELLL